MVDWLNRCHIGDVRDVLQRMIADGVKVNCIVTSPPYWGLRSYLPAGHVDKAKEIGSEPTLREFITTMTDVFMLAREVLADDGTCWINMGDCYATGAGKVNTAPGGGTQGERWAGARGGHEGKHGGYQGIGPMTQPNRMPQEGLKPKDLAGQPWRLALALQAPQYSGAIKDEADRVWLAAMIDGEGCFFIHKRKAGTSAYSKHTKADGTQSNYTRTADTYGVGMEISNTHKAIIDRCVAIAGGTVTTQGSEQNSRRKQLIYRWRIAPNEAKRIAQEVYPHLVGKRHQARLLFNCPSSGEAGAAAHQAMMDLHNGVETAVDYPPPPSLFGPGWYLRQDVIWGKPNPMPESTRDRCTKAHEYIFLMSKSERYYWNFDAFQEPVSGGANPCRRDNGVGFGHGFDKVKKPRYVNTPAGWATGTDRAHDEVLGRYTERRKLAEPGSGTKNNTSMDEALATMPDTRNPRSVWTIPTQSYKGSHFATFPEALVERCLFPGCPPGGTVLDIFMGSGTTGQVAQRMGMNWIGIDIDERNAELQADRIGGQQAFQLEQAA